MINKKLLKITLAVVICIVGLSAALLALYLKVLPYAVQNQHVIDCVENLLQKYAGLELEIESPVLSTELSPVVGLKIEKIKLNKGDERLLAARNFDAVISFANVFKKQIIVNKFGADGLFVDVNKLTSIMPQAEQQQEQKPSDWSVDVFDAVLYLNDSMIIYNVTPDTLVKVTAKNLELDNTQKDERYVHFDIDVDITKNNKTVNIAIADENKVVIKNKQINVNDCAMTIDDSKMYFNAWADQKNNFEFVVYAKQFYIPDVIELLLTDVIENNIGDILVYFDELNGNFDFAIKLDNKGIDGEVKLNKVVTKLVPLANLPTTLNKGTIKLDDKNIVLTDFEGFYDNNPKNTITFDGTVNDYLDSLDTTINMKAKLTNDFTEKYLSNLVGAKITLVGSSNAFVRVKSIYNTVDVIMTGKIAKGDDILIEGSSLSPTDYDRALKTDLHFENNILNIKDVNYYIASELQKGSNVKPILTLNGNFDVENNKIVDMGFDIPKPLPSEFLNVLIGQKLFKYGTFTGNLHYYDNNDSPAIEGDITAEKIIIPSQRLLLKSGSIHTANGNLYINADGKYRRSGYNLKGTIGNAIKFPIIVKDINLTIDEIDIYKMLTSMNTTVDETQTSVAVENIQSESDIESDEGAPTFDMSNLIIQNCVLQVLKGSYKEIDFDDLKATLTLDKDSILQVHSNKFNIAEGTSSAKINCDLKNHKYSVTLGIKDVNSDTMSTAILDLPREISGKASGLITLNTDDSLKLSGLIKFAIQDGQIQKVGLVEYLLKFAAVFRNPVTMISPSIFADMVNIPDGYFDKISGDLVLKDNVIEMMKIKSYASQLSAYIVGRYDIDTGDASLRIYTKFSNEHKGFAGALRNISLNSLANRIPLTSRNDSNYYAAELEQLPDIDADEDQCQIFLTKVDGDVEHNNFISSLKKIK